MASKLELMKQRGSARTGEPEVKIIPRGDSSPDDYADINIDTIELNPHNDIYRQMDEDSDVELLAEDIRRSGLLHNLVVYPKEGVGGRYVLLSGERRLKALKLLVEQERREKEAAGAPGTMSQWQIAKCKVVRGLSDNEKIVYLDAANLQVRGSVGNEKVLRLATMRFIQNLQNPPYNMTLAQAKKALKEITPVNPRTINFALAIETELNRDLKLLLDEGFLTRSECETYLRLSAQEQEQAAEEFRRIRTVADEQACADIRKAFRDALLDIASELQKDARAAMLEEAVAAAQEKIQSQTRKQRRPRGNPIVADKNYTYISSKLPQATKKIKGIVSTEGIEDSIRSYSPEERQDMKNNLSALIEQAARLRDLLDDAQ